MKILTKFNLLQEIYIPKLKLVGNILAIYITGLGISYYVRYFSGVEAKEIYFYENELALPPEEKDGAVGFKA